LRALVGAPPCNASQLGVAVQDTANDDDDDNDDNDSGIKQSERERDMDQTMTEWRQWQSSDHPERTLAAFSRAMTLIQQLATRLSTEMHQHNMTPRSIAHVRTQFFKIVAAVRHLNSSVDKQRSALTRCFVNASLRLVSPPVEIATLPTNFRTVRQRRRRGGGGGSSTSTRRGAATSSRSDAALITRTRRDLDRHTITSGGSSGGVPPPPTKRVRTAE